MEAVRKLKPAIWGGGIFSSQCPPPPASESLLSCRWPVFLHSEDRSQKFRSRPPQASQQSRARKPGREVGLGRERKRMKFSFQIWEEPHPEKSQQTCTCFPVQGRERNERNKIQIKIQNSQNRGEGRKNWGPDAKLAIVTQGENQARIRTFISVTWPGWGGGNAPTLSPFPSLLGFARMLEVGLQPPAQIQTAHQDLPAASKELSFPRRGSLLAHPRGEKGNLDGSPQHLCSHLPPGSCVHAT